LVFCFVGLFGDVVWTITCGDIVQVSGGKTQSIVVLVVMLVIFAGITGIIPEEWFIPLYVAVMVGVVGYIVFSFVWPFFNVAGKHMLALAFYRNSSETEWAFGKIAESEGGIIFKECPGGDKSLICAEIQPVPFLPTRVPFRMVVLKFPEEVDPYALFDSDYVEPESGFGRIPVNVAYISGVKIGEMVLSRNTAFKSWKDKLLEFLGRKVERIEHIPIVYVTRYKIRKIKILEKVTEAIRKRFGSAQSNNEERAPVILVTGHKVADLNTLAKIKKELKENAGYQEVKGSAKAWVTELGSIKVISTELEELRMDVMKLRQIVRGMERVYQSPPSITLASIEIQEGTSRMEMVKQVSMGVAAVVVVLLILLLLGVIHP